MWHVGIERDNMGIGRSVTIRVANEDMQTGVSNVLLSDGAWATLQPGVQPPADTGFQLPMDCLRELQAALSEYLGDRSGDKELRADLLTEKRRVEELHQGLLQMLAPQSSVLYADTYASTPMQTSGIMKGVSPTLP